MYNKLIIALILLTIGQILAYFQLQGQFMSNWFKNNPLIVSFSGLPISYILIKSTQYCSESFNGQVWPGRLIGFSIGAIVFALLSKFLMSEELNTKTVVCLGLASLILIIQIFWK